MKKIIIPIILLLLVSSVNADIIISEIMYDPSGSDSGKEWIELYNNGNNSVNMAGWKFREEGSNHGLYLQQGSFNVAPGEFLIIARNQNIFFSTYPSYSRNLVNSSFSLKNSGEELYIIDSGDNEIDFVNYTDKAAAGNSIEIIDAYADNSNDDNWIEGAAGGDPGNIRISQQKEEEVFVPEFNMNISAILFIIIFLVIARKKI